MQHPLKLRKIGNSLGVTFSKEVLAELNIGEGDILHMTKAPDGSWRLTPFDETLDKQLKSLNKGMRKYRNTLRELAK